MQSNSQTPAGAWGIHYLAWGDEEFQALEKRAGQCPPDPRINLQAQQRVQLIRPQMLPMVQAARTQGGNYARLKQEETELLANTSDSDRSVETYLRLRDLFDRTNAADMTSEQHVDLQSALGARLNRIADNINADHLAQQRKDAADAASQEAARQAQTQAEIAAQKAAVAERQRRDDEVAKQMEAKAAEDAKRKQDEFMSRPECKNALETQKTELGLDPQERIAEVEMNLRAGEKARGCDGLAKFIQSTERVRSAWAACSLTAAIQYNEMKENSLNWARQQGCDVP